LVDQLDGTIEIPEMLHFACNDRSQLMDQLKVLQMVLRKERNKNRNNQSMTDNSFPTQTQFLSTDTSSTKEHSKEKVEKHKKATVQKKQDKLKQMDVEAQAKLSRALTDKECESSESIKVSETENKFVNC